ncbi:hypothetical protein OKW29_008190 [Paraburkholderia sp. CI3]
MRIFLIFVGPMSLSTLLADLAAHIQTDQFRQLACDPEHPTALQRRRKLPLPALIALMLTGMRKSVRTELDEFFAHLQQQAQLLRQVSGQAFAQARAKLATTAIPALNDRLLEQAAATSLADALALIARHTFRHRPGISKPRKPRSKPPQIHDAKALLKDLFLNLGGLVKHCLPATVLRTYPNQSSTSAGYCETHSGRLIQNIHSLRCLITTGLKI